MLNPAWVASVAGDVGKKVARDGRLTNEFKSAMHKRLLAFDKQLPPLHFAQLLTATFLQ